jgi:hypothetical protein
LYGVGLLAQVLASRKRECLLIPIARLLISGALQICAGNPSGRLRVWFFSVSLGVFNQFGIQALDFSVLTGLN